MSLRVIGGACRGRRLLSVRGPLTRPTADRVRESIFNILTGKLAGRTVLDLFAGTGALGIEALSRGADQAVFVDYHRQSLEVIKKNLSRCGLDERARVLRWDITDNLSCLKSKGRQFDLVFMDPPYRKGFEVRTLRHLHKADVLVSGALVVIEHAVDDPLPDGIADFIKTDNRRYGNTSVSLLIYEGADRQQGSTD